MGAPKGPPEEHPKLAPLWIVTFTDMSSLLLTFFIMILTFSSMEEEKLKQATGSLSGGFGVMTPPNKRNRAEIDRQLNGRYIENDRKGEKSPSERKDRIEDAIHMVQDRRKFNQKITFEDMIEGFRLRIQSDKGEELFDFGTDQYTRDTNKTLEEIAIQFRGRPCRVVIEAHCDTVFPEFFDKTPRELTTHMALLAAETMISHGMTPEKVGVSPMGALHEIASNDDEAGRYKNRRLELIVIPHNKDPIYRTRFADR